MSNIKKDIIAIFAKHSDDETVKVKALISSQKDESSVSVISSSVYTQRAVLDLYSYLQNVFGVSYFCGVLTIEDCPQEAAKEIANYICTHLEDIGYKAKYSEQEKVI